MIHRCKTHGSRLCWFCLTQSMVFPVEHFLWEKAPILSGITKTLGL